MQRIKGVLPQEATSAYTRTLPLVTCSHASGQLLVHVEGWILCNVVCISVVVVVVVVVVVFEGGVRRSNGYGRRSRKTQSR